MTAISHIHSLFAWTLMILVIISIISSLIRAGKASSFKNPLKGIYLLTMILIHLQAILGILLYFTSSKVVFSEHTMSETSLRFFALEHPLLMIIAAILVTMGYTRAKRVDSIRTKFKSIFIYYLVAFILILIRFPWQYLSSIGKGWFV